MSELTRHLDASAAPVDASAAPARSYGRQVQVPVLGEVTVPPADKLAYYAGLGALAAFQVIEWPIALVVTAGHLLADQHLSGLARGVGQAMEQA